MRHDASLFFVFPFFLTVERVTCHFALWATGDRAGVAVTQRPHVLRLSNPLSVLYSVFFQSFAFGSTWKS
jgi:hypothetical protein